MRIYLDHVGILELFAEAQSLATRVLVSHDDFTTGFIAPQKGKSGLSKPSNRTVEEKRAARSAVVSESRRRAIAKDPQYRAREQAKSRERVKRWRARKKEAGQ